MRNLILFIFVIGFGASGCASTTEEIWEQPVKDLRTRAAFDLDCPASELTFHELTHPSQQGVVGCGQRVTYVYVRTTGWVLNSVDHPATSPTPQAPSAPPEQSAE